jgi:hypothetical protein
MNVSSEMPVSLLNHSGTRLLMYGIKTVEDGVIILPKSVFNACAVEGIPLWTMNRQRML